MTDSRGKPRSTPESQPTPVPNEQPDENPWASLPVNITIPPIEVKWVNAFTLGEYEIWLSVASLAFSSGVGFLVAYLQSRHHILAHESSDATYAVVAGIFFLLFGIFLARGLWLRHLLWQQATTYEMTASSER